MCGILGGLNYPGLEAAFPDLLERIAHRGPDAAGTYLADGPAGRIALGHRRLSIIDVTEGANQPFEKDGLVIVFNGEIYNYQDLTRDLAQLGVRFRTKSDTEVLLEAWRAWGPDCLPRLRGMFAFALYDTRTGHLALARDPFGIKPIYVARRGGGLAFCSELKGLTPVLGEGARINDQAVMASLLYGWLPDDECLYDGVSKLGAGRWLDIRPGGSIVEHVYWNEATLLTQDRPEVSVEELRAIIEDSVRLHMIADVPVYTFLSGGLDSSILTVLAKRHASRLESYTIGFRAEDMALEAMPDDLKYARMVAQANGIDLHEIEVRPEMASLLPRMAHILDEPVGDPAAINVFLICQAAHQAGVKVLLSGQGADELFGGYRRHYASLLAGRLSRVLPLGLIKGVVNALPVAGKSRGYRTVRWAKRFLGFAGLPEDQAYLRSYTHYDREQLNGLAGHPMPEVIDALFERHAALYAEGPADDQINRMCFTDLRMFMRGLNLFYSDRASMAASTEVRVPFVDLEVVKAAFAISGRQKIQGRAQKVILKQAAEAWLPKSIVHRPKASFNLPLRAWLRGSLREMVEDVLPLGEPVQRGYVSAAHVRRLIDDDAAGVNDNSRELWQLLTLHWWLVGQRKTGHGSASGAYPAV